VHQPEDWRKGRSEADGARAPAALVGNARTFVATLGCLAAPRRTRAKVTRMSVLALFV
jgi:hypothetical protein